MTNIIDLIATGEAAQAKDELNDLLASKAFQALDARKQQLAQSIYGNNVVTDESETTEDNESLETKTEYTEEE